MRTQRPTRAERRRVSAALEMDAAPERIFAVLADLGRHPEIDGSGTVLGAATGPDHLHLGAEFTMGMAQLGRRYRSLSTVVEYEEGRRLTWETVGVWHGHRIIGGQRWRWTLTPRPGGGTAVEHTYLWGYARLPLLTVWLPGYPARARRTLRRSLLRLAALVTP